MTNNQYDEIIRRLEVIEDMVGNPPPINIVQQVEGYNWWLLGLFLIAGVGIGRAIADVI